VLAIVWLSFAGLYALGGAFVDYLLIRFGGPTFFDLYHGITSNDIDAACRRVLGVSLEELEEGYTRHLNDAIAAHGSLAQWRLEELRRGPDVLSWAGIALVLGGLTWRRDRVEQNQP